MEMKLYAEKYQDGTFNIRISYGNCGHDLVAMGALNATSLTKNDRHRLADLFAASPDIIREMKRYLPVLERAESDPKLWAELTDGLGIATANGYRHAIAKAQGAA